MATVDARGLSCPEPVLLTQQAIAKGLPVTVLVDNMTPVKNISRLVVNSGLQAKCVETPEGDYEITIESK